MVDSTDSASSSPKKFRLVRRNAVYKLSKEDDDESFTNLNSRDRGEVSVKEAIGGLFSTKSTQQITPHELILVKKYSHGKSFGQRLAYITYIHQKTSIIIRYIAMLLTLTACALYIAEAIYIDIQLHYTDANITLHCGDIMIDYREAQWESLVLVPKPDGLWIAQFIVSLVSLIGACVTFYVRRKVHGSVHKFFWRYLDFSLIISFFLGIGYVITIFYPLCLHQLFIPSFLYCWPARAHFMYIILQHNKLQLFRSGGLRVTFLSLATILVCFFFSCICFIHHFERIGNRISLFDSYWLIVITFTTVGYGDVTPTHWLGKVIITLFLFLAVIYLPSNVERLWNTYQLHRKHHNTYQKTESTKHVLFIAVDLKPLVLRDFLTEFYSDPKRIDTQCVILVENELPDTLTQHLSDPFWNRRIIVLLGSALKNADLARAKARKADACFIRTTRDKESADEADKHTILSAWTVKTCAPHCKLYVHVIKPESKFHLDIAHEVLCENELKYSLLAINSMCPGIVTMATLLMHTFNYEERGFENHDYKSYEKSSPTEIYHIKLGDSQYFHHFEGRNFLFTAVVAYRKFHVVLIGVRRSGIGNIIFNPGINYVMKSDDVCYYMSETKEEYSDFRVVKPTCFQEGLWKSSAMLGLLALNIADIRPEQLFGAQNEENLKFPAETFRKISTMSKPSIVSENNLEQEVCIEDEEDLDEQLLAEATNWHHDVNRGIKLLRYHGGERRIAKPTIKYTVQAKPDSRGSVTTVSTDVGTALHTPLETIPEIELVVVETKQTLPQSPKRLHRKSATSLQVDNKHKSSKQFDNASLLSATSQKTVSSTHSRTSYTLDPTVVLELNDISDIEELEDLEEGKHITVTEEDDNNPIVPLPSQAQYDSKYTQGTPELPYCGCEPFECHLLLHPATISDIRIDQGCISEDITKHWQQKSILVYSDQVTPNLYHFITPLRAAYIPACALHPIVLILGTEPNSSFINLISEVPMVYYLVGSISKIDTLLRAGVMHAESFVIIATSSVHVENKYEHLPDASHITAVHEISRVFPHLQVTTDVRYRYNIRFLYNTPYEQMSLEQLKQITRKTDHFTYLFLPQFISGKAFSGTFLDTLLYQSYHKPHIIQLFRQLLGCIQVEGSGFLWKIQLSDEFLKLQKYVRVYQRLVSTYQYIPLGIYRSSLVAVQDRYDKPSLDKIEKFLSSRLCHLGINLKEECLHNITKPCKQQFVFVNPEPDFIVEKGDIVLVIRPRVTENDPCSLEKPANHIAAPHTEYTPHTAYTHTAYTPASDDDHANHTVSNNSTLSNHTKETQPLPICIKPLRKTSASSSTSLSVVAELYDDV